MRLRRSLQAAAAVIAASVCMNAAIAQDFVTVDPKPQGHAWWLRVRFHPTGTEVRGIPVHDIAANWCRATEFRRDQFPRELDFSDGAAFAIDGFFDDSGIKETAVTGAYETCGGKTGSFLMIVRPQGEGRPEVRLLDTHTGEHPFRVLRRKDGSTISAETAP